jgi:hypothetical protein
VATPPVRRKQIEPFHARFTGTLVVPSIALLATTKVTVTLTPVTTGDSLAAGEFVTLHINLGSSLPSGISQSYDPQATAINTIQVTLAAFVAITGNTSVPVTVLAHR